MDSDQGFGPAFRQSALASGLLIFLLSFIAHVILAWYFPRREILPLPKDEWILSFINQIYEDNEAKLTRCSLSNPRLLNVLTIKYKSRSYKEV